MRIICYCPKSVSKKNKKVGTLEKKGLPGF